MDGCHWSLAIRMSLVLQSSTANDTRCPRKKKRISYITKHERETMRVTGMVMYSEKAVDIYLKLQ